MQDSSLPTGVDIRLATVEDHDALVDLDIRTWDRASSPGEPPDRDTAFFRKVGPQDTIVATFADALIGYVRLGHPTPLAASRHVIDVAGLAVDQSMRRQGIAAALMRTLIEHARMRGARKISLRVMGSNPGAQQLYKRLGFHVEGHLVDEFFVEGRYVDDLLMAMHLHSAGDA